MELWWKATTGIQIELCYILNLRGLEYSGRGDVRIDVINKVTVGATDCDPDT